MKIKATIIAIALAIVTSCSGDAKKENEALKQQMAKLKKENSELKAGEKKLKTSIEGYNKFLKEIEGNLAEINTNKELLVKLNKEVKGKKSLSGDIKAHINSIKALMENSRLKIVSLDKSLVKLRNESSEKSENILEMDRKIKSLTKELMSKDMEISELEFGLSELQDLYQTEVQTSTDLKYIINRAYYISKTSKELKEAGIISKEGGFIGLGKVKVLNANAQNTLFNEVKKDETKTITLSVKKAKLISKHPEGSYSFEGNATRVDSLVIIDSQSFWSQGNYLVIEIEK